MKIYTKNGDHGLTSIQGDRMLKNDDLFELIGNIDELNSLIGVCRSFLLKSAVNDVLHDVQRKLFHIGADLSSRDPYKNALTEFDVLYLEDAIDMLDKELPPLKFFILPGGKNTTALLHQARSVCRRAERSYWNIYLWEEEKNPAIGKYLNRLSDFLFTSARYENHHSVYAEEIWKVE
jgi:cob(I)alamin adenosyltransferase